jgi:hypothetical protein
MNVCLRIPVHLELRCLRGWAAGVEAGPVNSSPRSWLRQSDINFSRSDAISELGWPSRIGVPVWPSPRGFFEKGELSCQPSHLIGLTGVGQAHTAGRPTGGCSSGRSSCPVRFLMPSSDAAFSCLTCSTGRRSSVRFGTEGPECLGNLLQLTQTAAGMAMHHGSTQVEAQVDVDDGAEVMTDRAAPMGWRVRPGRQPVCTKPDRQCPPERLVGRLDRWSLR